MLDQALQPFPAQRQQAGGNATAQGQKGFVCGGQQRLLGGTWNATGEDFVESCLIISDFWGSKAKVSLRTVSPSLKLWSLAWV